MDTLTACAFLGAILISYLVGHVAARVTQVAPIPNDPEEPTEARARKEEW